MRGSRIICGHKLVLAVAAACFCFPATGHADVWPGIGILDIEDDAARESDPLPLRLEVGRAADVHRIRIPAAVLARLADVPLRARRTTSASTARSVAAGIALSLAVGCGFVAYRRGRAPRIAAATLVGLAVAGGGALICPAWADIMPEFGWRPQPRGVPVDRVELRQGGRVILELTEADDEAIVMVVGGGARR